MRKQTKIGLVLVLAIVLTLNNTPVNAESSLSQDFEGALSGWSGASGGSHGGVIVPDPQEWGNNVLSFTATGSSAAIFSPEFAVGRYDTLLLTFDYLGNPPQGGESGGRLGFANSDYSDTQWLAGTSGLTGDPLILADDGRWHSYRISFDPSESFIPDTGIRLIITDAVDPAENAYFDNVELAVAATILGPVVKIDIKPESAQNSVRCNSGQGVIPVAIMGTEVFDVAEVDPSTVLFEGATHNNKGRPTGQERDVDRDGYIDLLFLFRLADTDLDCNSIEGTLTGRTRSVLPFKASDTLNMVAGGKS